MNGLELFFTSYNDGDYCCVFQISIARNNARLYHSMQAKSLTASL